MPQRWPRAAVRRSSSSARTTAGPTVQCLVPATLCVVLLRTHRSSTESCYMTKPSAAAMKDILMIIVRCAARAALDGRLRKATRLKGIEGFRAADNGLVPMLVDTWGHLVFVRISEQAGVEGDSC